MWPWHVRGSESNRCFARLPMCNICWSGLKTNRSIKSAIFRAHIVLWCSEREQNTTHTKNSNTNRLRDMMKFRAIFQTPVQRKWNAFAFAQCRKINSRARFDFAFYVFTLKKRASVTYILSAIVQLIIFSIRMRKLEQLWLKTVITIEWSSPQRSSFRMKEIIIGICM